MTGFSGQGASDGADQEPVGGAGDAAPSAAASGVRRAEPALTLYLEGVANI
jgi:hypothetical protein